MLRAQWKKIGISEFCEYKYILMSLSFALWRYYEAKAWLWGGWQRLSLCHFQRTNGEGHSRTQVYRSWPVQWQFIWNQCAVCEICSRKGMFSLLIPRGIGRGWVVVPGGKLLYLPPFSHHSFLKTVMKFWHSSRESTLLPCHNLCKTINRLKVYGDLFSP